MTMTKNERSYVRGARLDSPKLPLTDAQFRRLRAAIEAGVTKTEISRRFGRRSFSVLERDLKAWEKQKR